LESSRKERENICNQKIGWDPSDSNQISEILIHQNLKHKYIVPLFEVFSTPSMILHIVMEECESDLEKYLVDPSSITSSLISKNKSESSREEIAKLWFPKIVEAVHYIHSMKYIHRDIKPANILLKLYFNEWIPLLSDFGLAKYLTTASLKAKSYACSPFWSAPELWSPIYGIVEKYSNKVDIWSLGIVLLQMWFGIDSKNDEIRMKILMPIGGQIQNVPKIIDLVFSAWPNISDDIFELISKILVLENNRVTSDLLMKILIKLNWIKD